MNRGINYDSKRPEQNRAGVSLVEVAISTLIVGLLLVAALKSSGQTIHSRTVASHPLRGETLAHDLLAEVLNADYEDVAYPIFGPEPDDLTGTRSEFDDVDDWHGWLASPPEYSDGTAIPDLTGWQRDVTVDFVDLSDPSTISASDQGLKRITVSVRRDGMLVGQAVSLRSNKR